MKRRHLLQRFFGTRRSEHLSDEIADFIERETEDNIARGMSPAEARVAAKRRFGNAALIREEVRRVWTPAWIDHVRQDATYAIRALRKTPGFAVAMVMMLALGIGANAAIFTLMNAALWRRPAVTNPETLLVAALERSGTTSLAGFDYTGYEALRASDTVSLAGFATAPINARIQGALEPTLQGQLVSGNYFPLVGLKPAAGRLLGPDDDRVPEGHAVAVLAYGYWSRRFARDPSVVGHTINISNVPFTIVGVAPPEFMGVESLERPDIFLPLMMQPAAMPAYENLLRNPIVFRTWIHVIGRANSGFTAARASAELDSRYRLFLQLRDSETSPKRQLDVIEETRLALAPATGFLLVRARFSRLLFLLMGIVGVVLLIVCANTANLALARASARRREFGVRLALGAGRWRLIRQLIVESLILAGAGGIIGIIAAYGATRLLAAFFASVRAAIALNLNPDLRVLAFTAIVSVLSGILFGLAPAWQARREESVLGALRSGGLRVGLARGSTAEDRAGGRFGPGRFLVMVQVSLSIVLLAVAGLLVRSLNNLTESNATVPGNQVFIARVEPRGSDQRGVPGTAVRLNRLYRDLTTKVRMIPGVVAAGMAHVMPQSPNPNTGIRVSLPDGRQATVPLVQTYAGYFEAAGMSVVAGRTFSEADMAETAAAVCLVNEAFVRNVLPGRNPLGQPCFAYRRPRIDDSSSRYGENPESYTIVGVVRDSRYMNPTGEIEPIIYTTFLQTPTGRGQMVLYARTESGSGAVAPSIRRALAEVDPSTPVFDLHTLEQDMEAALVRNRLVALLSALFSCVAVVLACIGLYGLLAYLVARRTSELGIRIALGAARTNVLWLVMREALLLVGVGLAIGIAMGLSASRVISSQAAELLFGLDSNDPAAFVSATAILFTVAMAAAFVPAWRASSINPVAALRQD